MPKNESPEQETQHKNKREATQDAPVDPSDADTDIEQETQNVKRAAAQSAEEGRGQKGSK